MRVEIRYKILGGILFPADPVLVFSDAAGVEEASFTFKGMGV